MKKVLTVIVAAMCIGATWPLGASANPPAEARVDAGALTVTVNYQGVMTGNEPPPSGSPISIHAGANGAPSPVTPGDKATVIITFDETVRMP